MMKEDITIIVMPPPCSSSRTLWVSGVSREPGAGSCEQLSAGAHGSWLYVARPLGARRERARVSTFQLRQRYKPKGIELEGTGALQHWLIRQQVSLMLAEQRAVEESSSRQRTVAETRRTVPPPQDTCSGSSSTSNARHTTPNASIGIVLRRAGRGRG